MSCRQSRRWAASILSTHPRTDPLQDAEVKRLPWCERDGEWSEERLHSDDLVIVRVQQYLVVAAHYGDEEEMVKNQRETSMNLMRRG